MFLFISEQGIVCGDGVMTDKYTRDFGVGVSDEKVFGFTDDVKSKVEENALNKQLEGIQIFTSSVIDVEKRQTFPLIWLTSYTDYRHWEVIKQQNSHLVVTNLDDGLTHVFYAFPTKKRKNQIGRASCRERV